MQDQTAKLPEDLEIYASEGFKFLQIFVNNKIVNDYEILIKVNA